MTSRRIAACGPLLLVLSACAAGADRPAPDAGDASVDAGAMDAGTAPEGGVDAATDAGPLERVGLCEACTLHEQCGDLARCIRLTGGDFVCAAVCNPDIPGCPRGFDCVLNFAAPDVTTCVPIGETCCIDQDADDYGRGVGCLGPDCDDDEIAIHPGADELCNGMDDDCDDTSDEDVVDCGGQRCVSTGTGTFEAIPPNDCAGGECTVVGAESCVLYTCIDGDDRGDVCGTTCTRDAADDDLLCIRAAHCDFGVCERDYADGSECDEDTDCDSGHCDNGFCCDEGICCSEASDCPSSGGTATVCDDSATCQGSRGEVTCSDTFRCSTRSGVPDDSACDMSVEASGCGFFRSVFCTGDPDQPPPRCPTTCASDLECDEGAHCDGVCVPDLVDGELCDEASDCESGYCDNDVCCSGGDCCRSPDECPASYSTPPVCDSPTTCQGSRDRATCSDFVCGTDEGVDDDSACGVGIEALTCGLYPSRFCTGGSEQPPPVCAMGCTADAECDEVAHCDSMACVPDLPDGMACDEPSDCISGHCQNGFCCASGDCCADARDCDDATYGRPSLCLDASTCQGERIEPACTAAFQCTLGPSVPDDSGCAGLLAHTCGFFPSVFCTGAESQSPTPGDRCAMMCMSALDCDPGAYCTAGGACESPGLAGDPCTSSAMCASGLSCVDDVCCASSCTGACMACNVAGSEGTCSPVPAGTDPEDECDGLSCSGYFHGWLGNTCYQRANAIDSAVDCDGAGACEDAADVCPGQGRGPSTLTCNATCQSTAGGTCTGTTPGTCNDDPPGSQSCGIGACRRTVAECNMGTPVTCVPGPVGTETCNDIDDDCDTSTDEGLSGDAYTNFCNGYDLGTVWTASEAGRPTTVTVPTPSSIYGSGDRDVFKIRYQENDSSCGCGASTDEDYAINATLSVPANAGSYRICHRWSSDGCATTGGTCITVSAGGSGTLQSWDDGCCSPIGCNDSRTAYYYVEGVGAPGFECNDYTLRFTTTRGCR